MYNDPTLILSTVLNGAVLLLISQLNQLYCLYINWTLQENYCCVQNKITVYTMPPCVTSDECEIYKILRTWCSWCAQELCVDIAKTCCAQSCYLHRLYYISHNVTCLWVTMQTFMITLLFSDMFNVSSIVTTLRH